MPTITVEEAATRLPEIIRESPAGEEITLTQNSIPIAKLIPLASQPRKAGSAAHLPHWMAEDFDEIPEGFEGSDQRPMSGASDSPNPPTLTPAPRDLGLRAEEGKGEPTSGCKLAPPSLCEPKRGG